MHEPLALLFATKSCEAPRKRAEKSTITAVKTKSASFAPLKHAMVTMYKSEIRQKYRHVQA